MASIDSKGRVLLEVKVMSNGTSSRNNSGKIRSATIDEVWKNSELTSSTAKKTKRMRSRNRVIDDWLGDEAGDDAYADLEDFIV